MTSARPIEWFADLDYDAKENSSAAIQMAQLTQSKFPVVPGFVITPLAYQDFLHVNNLKGKINQLLSTVSFERPDSLMQGEFHIKQLFARAWLSDYFINELMDYYQQLGDDVSLELYETGKHGKKHSKKLINDKEELKKEIIRLWSEMFSGNALYKRHQHRHDHLRSSAEIIVRKIIRGNKTGTIFTLDPFTHEQDKLVIITEMPQDGDTYILSKKNLTIIDRMLKHSVNQQKLTLDDIHAIAGMGKRLGEYDFLPREITWIIDNDKLYIKAIKPFTEPRLRTPQKKAKLPIARGKGLTNAIGTGVVSVINLQTVPPTITNHTIIVTPDLNSHLLKKIKKAKGLIIENHPHMETVSLIKLLGIPAICNVKNATKNFRNGHIVSIHGQKGEIYVGGLLN